MKKLILSSLLSAMLAASSAHAQGSSAVESTLGFLSSATTGSAGCVTLGMGNPPCFVPYSTSNPLPITTSGGGGSVTWPTSGDAVISNASNSPAGVAPVNGDCLIGSGGAWTAGSCSGGSGVSLSNTTSNLTYYLGFTTSTSGSLSTLYGNASDLFFNPSTGVLNALGVTTTTLTGVNASLSGTTTLSTAQILAGNALLTTVTATNFEGTSMALSGTATIGTAQIAAGNALLTTLTATNIEYTNALGTTITGTTGHFPTLTFTTATGTNLSLAGTITASGLSSGTVAASSYLGLNSSNQVVLGAGGSTSPATPAQSFQYDNGGSFGGSTGLYYSTTRSGIDFLASVTTANLLSLGDNGADVTSYALGESALLAQSTTNRQSNAIGAFALTGATTGTNNNAFGYSAGQTITTGTNNTILGDHVGSTTLTTGSDNILMGVNNAIDATTSSESNSIHIGGTGGDWVHTTGTNVANSQVTAMAGALNTSSTSATAFTVGTAGTTTPIFAVNNSTASAVSGISITGAATGGTVVITGTDSGNNNSVTFENKGNGTALFESPSGSAILQGGNAVILKEGSTQVMEINSNDNLSITPSGATNQVQMTIQPAAVNSYTASTEYPWLQLGTSAITRQHATGALALQRDITLQGNNYSFVAASTVTNLATLGYSLPGCGTNASCTNVSGIYHASTALTVTGTATNSYAINVAADTGAANNYAASFTGNVGMGNTSPTDQLDLGGALGFTSTIAAASGFTGVHSQIANGLAFSTTGTDRLTISSNGLVTMSSGLNVTSTLQQGIELSCSTGLTTDGSGNINGCVASDASLKTNIQPLAYDATLIDRLKPVSYEWLEPSKYDEKRHGGFIAQQVQLVDPNAVKSAGNGLLGLDNSALAADIVVDLQHVHREIESIPALQADPCHNLNWLGRELFCR